MHLNDLLAKYPGIRLATNSDSESLQKFFAASPMDSAALQLGYEREPDFFTFLNYQGDEAFIFCAENSKGEFIGVASLSVRMGYVRGELKRIGYLSDLRVKKELQTPDFAKIWKDCMGDIITNVNVLEEIRADYLITAIMANNQKAKRALVNHPKNAFHYEKLSSYKMVNIVTTFFKSYQGRLLAQRACEKDKERVLDFLEEHFKKQPFGFTHEFVDKALKNWEGFSIDNFIIIENAGEIVAITSSWNPSPIKKIIIKKLPWELKVLNFFASLFTKTPKENEELKVQYLNFLSIKQGYEESLLCIVDFLKNEKIFQEYDVLAYADFDIRPLPQVPRCISDTTPLELYQVVAKDKLSDILILSNNPGFEISLV